MYKETCSNYIVLKPTILSVKLWAWEWLGNAVNIFLKAERDMRTDIEPIVNLFFIRNEQSVSYDSVYIEEQEGWIKNFIFFDVVIIIKAETFWLSPLQHTEEVRSSWRTPDFYSQSTRIESILTLPT